MTAVRVDRGVAVNGPFTATPDARKPDGLRDVIVKCLYTFSLAGTVKR